MTITTADITVLPPEQPMDDLLAAVTMSGDVELMQVKVVAPTGQTIALPVEVSRVLAAVVTAMASGQAITVAPHHQVLTTQEAADVLGVSRPTVVRLLDAGKIPYEQPGRHRRVLLRHVLDYAEKRRHERREALNELVDIGEESGMYEATAKPIHTR